MKLNEYHVIGISAIVNSVVSQIKFLEPFLGHDFASYVYKFLVALVLVLFAFKKEMRNFWTSVNDHVTKVETEMHGLKKSLDSVASSLNQMKTTLEKVEVEHGTKIKMLETQMLHVLKTKGDK